MYMCTYIWCLTRICERAGSPYSFIHGNMLSCRHSPAHTHRKKPSGARFQSGVWPCRVSSPLPTSRMFPEHPRTARMRLSLSGSMLSDAGVGDGEHHCSKNRTTVPVVPAGAWAQHNSLEAEKNAFTPRKTAARSAAPAPCWGATNITSGIAPAYSSRGFL